MKKLKILLLILVLTFVCTIPLALTGCDGVGGVYTKYISTVEDLLMLKEGGVFILVNDIDCEGKTLMGFNVENELIIDGQGHTIKNIRFNSEGNSFGFIASAHAPVTIKNLALVDFSVDTNKTTSNSEIYVGGFIGFCNSSADFSNCYAKGEINIEVKNGSSAAGNFGGYLAWCKFENCLTDGEINLHYDDFGFSTASVYAGGFVGRSGKENYAGNYNIDEYTNCVSLINIDVDTSLSMSWKTTTNIGGFNGFAGNVSISSCLSAPKKLYASTFVSSDVSVGGIKLIGTGKIAAFANAEYVSKNSRNYYCNFYNEELSAEDKALKCSDYEKLNGTNIGTAVYLDKTVMLSEAFMSNDYAFTDFKGEAKETYMQFDSEIWNFGYMEGGVYILPQLKVFD